MPSLGHREWGRGSRPVSTGLNNSASVEPREEKEAGSGPGKGQGSGGPGVHSLLRGPSAPCPTELPFGGRSVLRALEPRPHESAPGTAASLDSLGELRWAGSLDQLPK